MKKQIRRLILTIALALGVLAPASAQTFDPGALYQYPTSTVIACVYYATPLAALTRNGVWTANCDPNGNLKTTTTISNFPATQNVAVTNFPATQPVAVVSSGAAQTLATAVAATAAQAFTSTTFGFPKVLTVCMSASAATTFTVTTSTDGTTFYGATIANTATSANYVPAAAGTQCETVAPAAFVRVATSAANTVTIQAQAAY